MKKKLLYISLSITLLFSLTACVKEEANEEETKAPITDAGAMLDKFASETDENGEVSGENQKPSNDGENETSKVVSNDGNNSSNNGGSSNNSGTSNNGSSPNSGSSNNGNSSNNGSSNNNNGSSNGGSSNNSSSNNGGSSNSGNSNNNSSSSNNGDASKESSTSKENTTTKENATTKENPTTTQPTTTTTVVDKEEETTTSKPSTPATSGTVSGSVKWKLEGNTLTIYGSGAMPDYTSRAGMPSVKAYPWYEYLSDIQTVIVEDGITSIGSYNFGGSYTLKPNYPSLTYVKVADSVTKVNDNAFTDSKYITEIKMSNSLKSIGSYAFAYCTALSKINLPATTTTFGAFAFDQCYNLTVYGPSGTRAQSQITAWGFAYVVQ